MYHQHMNQQGSARGEDGTGLEGHLRNLILTNGPQTNAVGSGRPSAPPGLSQVPLSQSAANMTSLPYAESHEDAQGGGYDPTSGRGGRRRPNQAQRRQMSSQMTIPIEAHSHAVEQQTWRHGGRGNYSHNHGGPQRYHQHTASEYHAASPGWQQRETDSQWHGSSNHRQTHSYHRPDEHHSGGVSQRGRFSGGGPYNKQRQTFTLDEIANQSALLDRLAFLSVTNSEIEISEIAEKENFRQRIEAICRQAIGRFEMQENHNPDFIFESVELKCFGSLSSGFATKGSDMDLGLLSPLSAIQPDAAGSPIPRLLEKAFLDAGIGARLLSRTRVPIIKLCESPPEQLRKGLLDSRRKWEQGSVDDEHAGQAGAEDAEDDDANNGGDDQEDLSQEPDAEAPSPQWFEITNDQGYVQAFHLEQGPKQSISAYYALAKRVLRKAGGRDVRGATLRDFTEHEWQVLEAVCRAFVNGLYDTKFRDHLLQYPTLKAAGPNYRHSLVAVSLQMEGEHILEQWFSWSISPLIRSRKVPADHFVRGWYDLQNAETFAFDPAAFAKELQLLVEKLKKIPAIQLMLLQKGSSEVPGQYLNRVKAILRNLEMQWDELVPDVRQGILSKYVEGVIGTQPESITKSLALMLSQHGSNVDLDSLGRKHMALTYALELERAFEKGSYPEEYGENIKMYTTLLKAPMTKRTLSSGLVAFDIPVTGDIVELISWAKSIYDPHKLPPNATGGKYKDPLEFPKDGAGTQCDINFSAHLALQNTLLLRCYSHTDPRVRPIILFVKHWAKARGINSGYRGTMSSYGYVLMVLHYLVNIAEPPVCPNLQQIRPPNSDPQAAVCKGYNVFFWRNEQEIIHMAMNGQLTRNKQSIGELLRGFFEYYAQSGQLSTVSGKGFDWGRDVLSLRSAGGLVTKQSKGWTGAKTVYQAQESVDAGSTAVTAEQATAAEEVSKTANQGGKDAAVKEVRLRYLCAIEDPFELEHNVARTVTHNGIVSIRDELRRGWRVIQAAGQGLPHDDLVQDVSNVGDDTNYYHKMIDEIHGLAQE